MTGHRADRLSEELKKRISVIIRDELKDPDIPMMCSVLRVEVTRDMRHATVGVSVMGEEAEREKALRALTRSQGFVRSLLSRTMTIRYMPEIHFELDESISHSIRVGQILSRLHEEKSNDDEYEPPEDH